MDQPISLNDVRVAVSDLTAALLNHHALSDQQWDRAITALHIAREQHGGRIRHLIHVVLDAGHHYAPRHLADALTELHCHLAVADDPPPAQPAPRRRRRRRTWPTHIQLELFSSDTLGDHRSAL